VIEVAVVIRSKRDLITDFFPDHSNSLCHDLQPFVGDLNLDKATSISDFIDLSAHYNASGGWREGDLNYDKKVSISDFIDLSANFGQAVAGDVTPVPDVPMAASSFEITSSADVVDSAISTQKKKVAGSRRVIRHHHHRRHHRLAWLGAGK